MGLVSGRVSTINVDDNGNLGVNINSQEGDMGLVPAKTATLNVDENGNIGIFIQGSTGSGDPLEVAGVYAMLEAEEGITLTMEGNKIKIGIDKTVVDTTQEEGFTSEEIDDILDSL